MVYLLDIPLLKKLINKEGVTPFLRKLTDRLAVDFARWPSFYKSPRHAVHGNTGVLELMPTADDTHYTFKYVNGHPQNTSQGELCVTALGMLVNVHNGYPLMISEMTYLTALRTAATSALALRYLKTEDYTSLAIIGTGAQAEFQILALTAVLPGLTRIQYYDIDPAAMKKFEHNLAGRGLTLVPCASIESAVDGVKLIVTATAAKRAQSLFSSQWIQKGSLILAIGGDCPGKTELGIDLLKRCKIFVEHTPQTLIEGELQHLGETARYAELWEIVAGKKPAHHEDDDILLFDSVGFAIEDFSALLLVYELLKTAHLEKSIEMIPHPADPKNLFGELLR